MGNPGVYCSRNAGRIEHEMHEIVRDMTTGALGALASHGVLISGQGRIEVQKAVHETVTRSVEIESIVAMLIERGAA